MNNDYEISQDGTIFHIKEDGTISKLGRIENGKIVSSDSNANASTTDDEFSWKGVLMFFVVALTIATIVLGVLLSQAKDDYNSAQYSHRQEVSGLTERINSLTQERDQAIKEYNDFKSNLGKTIPFVITDIRMGNLYQGGDIETNYGGRIMTSNTMFLAPEISYVCFSPGNRTFYIKLFRPDGNMSIGESSPTGYSFSSTAYIGSGKGSARLSSWGNKTKGHWADGAYRIEIWYDNSCISSRSFVIYK